jgi:hypothetical protein
VDFIIMDDTNGRHADGGRIIDNIRAWFDFHDAKPPPNASPSALAAAERCAPAGRRTSRKPPTSTTSNGPAPQLLPLDGKPLLLIDTDKNYGPGDFDDPRFAVAGLLRRQPRAWPAIRPGAGVPTTPCPS